jgi:hypothetical protein
VIEHFFRFLGSYSFCFLVVSQRFLGYLIDGLIPAGPVNRELALRQRGVKGLWVYCVFFITYGYLMVCSPIALKIAEVGG